MQTQGNTVIKGNNESRIESTNRRQAWIILTQSMHYIRFAISLVAARFGQILYLEIAAPRSLRMP